jgi:hypothetical protein
MRPFEKEHGLCNKEALKRSGEKSYLDKYDVEVLKRIIEKRK